jgi:uncharacterized repeat protein (TIGR01451 family)/LPXTG-motif cell wall-anchored protein
MKTQIKAGALATVASAMLIATPIMAATAGQIEGGDIYRIKNLTQNVAFADPAKANACDLLEYKVRIHNPGPDALNNVNVKATLDSSVATSHSSEVTVTASNANPKTTTDTAGLNISTAQNISYVPGSTQLLDPNSAVLSNLPDGILTGSGVTIGDVGVSTHQVRYVEFEVKVNCPTPVTPSTTPTPPATTPATPSTPAAPTALPQTGADEFAGLAGMAGTGAIGYGAVMYRRSKKALASKLLRK